MKLLIIVLIVFVSSIIYSQDYEFNKTLPQNLELDKSIKQTYEMTTDYINFDLKSNFQDKKRITALYTVGLPESKVKWNNVKFSLSDKEEGEYTDWTSSDFMEDFTYTPSAEIVSPGFFSEIPEADIQYKNLVWDAAGFEAIAYTHWNSLKLNQECSAEKINGEIDLGNEGTFENKDIRLTWIGISEINNETCAVIKYSAMNNPLGIETESLTVTGRSHYWGEIYVSLEDKQIEYATLTEDVITDVKIPSLPNNILGYTVRYITLQKIK